MLEHAYHRSVRSVTEFLDQYGVGRRLGNIHVSSIKICTSSTYKTLAFRLFADRSVVGIFCWMGRLGRFSPSKLGPLGINPDIGLSGACRYYTTACAGL